jgi:hypothetical protein
MFHGAVRAPVRPKTSITEGIANVLNHLSRLALGLALLPPALSQEVFLSPAPPCGSPELRLIDAAPGARALVIDRTAMEGVVRPDGLPEGRIVGAAVVDARGEARFALPQEAFAARVPLAAVVTVGGRFVLVGSVTLPGSSPVASQASSGQSRLLLVTEFMKDPSAVSDARGEWIELINANNFPVDVEGWVLSDLGNDATVLTNGGNGIVVPAYSVRVLARNGDPALNGGVTALATYSGFTLGNGADQIILTDLTGQLVDFVDYLGDSTWPNRAGASVSLSTRAWLTGHDDVPRAWCEGESLMPAGDLGTPGRLNDTCWD